MDYRGGQRVCCPPPLSNYWEAWSPFSIIGGGQRVCCPPLSNYWEAWPPFSIIGGGGGAKGMLPPPPPSQIIWRPGPPFPTPMYNRDKDRVAVKLLTLLTADLSCFAVQQLCACLLIFSWNIKLSLISTQQTRQSV